MDVNRVILDYDLPTMVMLFIIRDKSSIVARLTNGFRDTAIFWEGQEFVMYPIGITGLGYTEDNLGEKPRFVISNVNQAYSLIFAAIPDLRGYFLDIILTTEDWVESNPRTSTGFFISKHRYMFAKLLSKNREQIVYEMDGLLSFGNRKMPNRQMLRENRPELRFPALGINKQYR